MLADKFVAPGARGAGGSQVALISALSLTFSSFFFLFPPLQDSLLCQIIVPVLFSKLCKFFQNSQSYEVLWASLVAQTVKNLPIMQETQVQPLGREDLLEKRMATHSSIRSWRIPWTEEPGGIQSMGSQRVRHDLATEHQ